jgi:hypothetical protein
MQTAYFFIKPQPFKIMPMPLHPGAARYYKEIGLTIPDNLIAK